MAQHDEHQDRSRRPIPTGPLGDPGTAADEKVRADGIRLWIDADGRAHIELEGDVDLARAAQVAAAVEAAERCAPIGIVVDLRRTTFMDVRGFRALLVAAERAYARGRPIELVGAPRSVRRILEVLELAWLFVYAAEDRREQN